MLKLFLMAGFALAASDVPRARAQTAGPPLPAPPARPANPVTDCRVEARDGGTVQTQMSSPQGTILFFTEYTVTCDYVGKAQSLTLPASADRGPVAIVAAGAAGGNYYIGGCCTANGMLYAGGRGLGAVVSAQGDIAPGTLLRIFVGGQGARPEDGSAGGFNGGGSGFTGPLNAPSFRGAGGGGASDVRTAPFGVENRLVVAGGGGGAGKLAGERSCPNRVNAGDGGTVGGDGGAGCPNQIVDRNIGLKTGGRGASQTAPGAGGEKDPNYDSQPGLPGDGANGGSAASTYGGGGGGGGGLYGGGSGATVAGGGGGGGSSRGFVGRGDAQIQAGGRDGNGQVVLRYRLFTKRVPCVAGASAKAQVRGETRIFCARFTPYEGRP